MAKKKCPDKLKPVGAFFLPFHSENHVWGEAHVCLVNELDFFGHAVGRSADKIIPGVIVSFLVNIKNRKSDDPFK